MVRVPAPDGATCCIDTTEVTMAHYAAFLAERKDDLSSQRDICKGNTSFEPPGPSSSSTHWPKMPPPVEHGTKRVGSFRSGDWQLSCGAT